MLLMRNLRESKRDSTQLCVVEDIRDVMAIENTGQYQGKYHVLNGIISPIDGIGPQDLTIHSLIEKVKREILKKLFLPFLRPWKGIQLSFTSTSSYRIIRRCLDNCSRNSSG